MAAVSDVLGVTALAGIALAAWAAVLLLPWQPHRVRERLEPDGRVEPLDDVTVLIPARNEAAVITRTLAALERQGQGLEVIVVDDESDDGTRELLARYHGPSLRLRVVNGRLRPPGWSGKLWALQQGLEQVRRPRVLLLDADIELAPGMIAALLAQARREGAGLVSIMATLRCETFAEKLLAPPFVFFFKLLYPFALANAPRSRVAAAAGGCILVTREALRDVGGFAALRAALIDDCSLAALLKRRGYRTWLGMSRSVLSLRAYTFVDFWRMVSRTAFTQLRYSPWRLAATVVAMGIVFGAPLAALGGAASPLGTAFGAGALIAMAAAYFPMVRFYRLPGWWVATLPLAALLFLGMTLDSARRYWSGVRAEWKGRSYRTAE